MPSNQPPFRMPCEGVSGKPLFFFGSAWQHNVAPVMVDKYTNTTLVSDWHTPPGADIVPYERSNSTGIPNCATDPICDSSHPPCSPWLQPYPTNTFAHTTGDQVNFAVSHKRGQKNVHACRYWHGTFGWISSQVDQPTNACSDGHTYRTAQTSVDDTKYLTITYDEMLVEIHYDSIPTQTDTSTASGSVSVDANSGEITNGLITTRNVNDGTTTFTDISGGAGYYNSGPVQTHGLGTPLDAQVALDLHFDTPQFFGQDLAGYIATWNASYPTATLPLITDPNSYSGTATYNDPSGFFTDTVTLTFSRTATVVSWDFHEQFTDPGSPSSQTDVHYYGSRTLSNANTSATVKADGENNLLVLWPLNDDALYAWRPDHIVSLAPLVTRKERRDHISPLGFLVHTVDDLRLPINDASGNTPFSTGWTPTYTQMTWIDVNVWVFTFADGTQSPVGSSSSTATATGILQLFDGSIVGAPLAAGYQNYFAFNYEDWLGCCDTDPGTGAVSWAWYQKGWGMTVGAFNSNAGCSLPLNCTQWTNYFQAVDKTQGAFLIYNDLKNDYYGTGCVASNTSGVQDSGALWFGKCAEIIEPWPSQNFARPAGDDKFLLDEGHVFCATNISGSGAGSTWTVTDPTTGVAIPDGTDVSGIWGSNAVGGFYSGNSLSGGVLTIGSTKEYDLPTGWKTRSNDDGANCIGKLRFPTAPALLGRIAVTPDGAGTTFTFATAQVNFGMDSTTHQEQVDLYDSSMTLLASNITATRTDDTHFSVSTSYLTAAFVMIHGAAAWYMNDTAAKGDYAVLEWLSDNRSIGEYGRLTGVLDCSGTAVAQPTTNVGGGPVTQPYASFSQTAGCLPFTPCAPKVVCISPNGETWPNGVTYPFPSTFPCDEQYGSKWWGFIQSTMTDLFWQQPHRPCNIDPTALWKEDDLTCLSDDSGAIPPIYYFGQPPQVEARLTVPCNYGMAQDECAPALPSGIQIGWLSPVNYSTGDVALPPEPPGPSASSGRPNGAVVAWSVHDYICTYGPGCRFGYFAPGC